MLACVFGAERFHTYVFGRSFTIESDHKPLEQINLKNLADTPARLQRMLLCLQNYDVKIIYRPGREMLVADTLSRYAPMPAPEVALDLAIHLQSRQCRQSAYNPRRTPRHLQMPVPSQTVCLLAWYQCRHQEDGRSMPNMPMTPPTGTTTTTPIHPST